MKFKFKALGCELEIDGIGTLVAILAVILLFIAGLLELLK